MGSNPKAMLTLCACLVVLLLSSLLPQPATSSTPPKVTLDLYYETLCGPCAYFLLNNLIKLFETGLLPIVDLKLHPSGNSVILQNSTVICEHGPNECLLNTVEACAIDIWPELNKHFPFIYCIEYMVSKLKYSQWEKCFEILDLDPKPITDCYTDEHGKELELQYAVETAALEPHLEYTPWVVVDGQPLYEDDANFVSYICKAYKGTAAPRICSEYSLSTIKMRRPKASRPVCYKEETKKSAFSAE